MSTAVPTAPARGRTAPSGASVPAAAPRLPRVARQRRAALAAVAVLLVVGFGALAGALVLRSGDRSSVVTVLRPIPAGAQVQAADLGVTDAAVQGVATVPAASLQSLVGQYATVPLVSGSLLNPVALSPTSLPGRGQAVVGLLLSPGQFPSDGLRSGDVLRIVRVTGAGTTSAPRQGDAPAPAPEDPVLVPRASVLSSRTDAVNGGTSVSVLVADERATALTIAAAKGEVAVARVVQVAP